MIVLAVAFIVIPIVIIIWVAYVGALGLRFCWNMLFRYSEMEVVETSTTESSSNE